MAKVQYSLPSIQAQGSGPFQRPRVHRCVY